jgi:hypothetical protein
LTPRFASSLWAGRIGLHVLMRQADQAALDADVDEHKVIAAAIEQGDGDRAEQLVHDRIAVPVERLMELQGRSCRARPQPPIDSPLRRKVSDGTRTRDRLDHNQELYLLSYAHREAFAM